MKHPPIELLLAARPDLDSTAAKQAELAQQLPATMFVAHALRELEQVADIIRSAAST